MTLSSAPSGGGHRTPVVLLHALSLHASMWQAQERALRARGHRVLAVDQRGFGTAPLGDGPPSLDVVAGDLARTLDGHGMDRVVLAGSSMGGYVAMAFLRHFPDRVAGLALLGTRATADGPEAAAQRLQFAELVQDPALRPVVVERVTHLLLAEATRAARPALLARVLADAHAADPAALVWAQRAIAARPDSTEVLRAARIPALVIAGGQDALVTPEESRYLADILPHGRLLTLPRSGHLPPLEAPDEVTDALHGLLDEIDGTGGTGRSGEADGSDATAGVGSGAAAC